MRETKTIMRHIGAILCVMALGLTVPEAALAGGAPAQPPDTCTDGPQFSTAAPPGSSGIVSTIATNVQTALNTVAQDLFLAIVGNGEFIYAAQGTLTLYIAIYGILFTFGMARITVFDFVTRLVKIAVVVILLSPNAWSFFSSTVVDFFNTLVNELVNAVTAIAVGGTALGATPLAVLDQALRTAVSANMAVHLLATAFTSAYGFVHALLIGLALWAFLGSILTGIWVFLMSMVLRALLFGVAPIFIVCLLFNRTRHLFDGWLNQVVNACLQPILLFTFFSFFVILILTSINNIIQVPVCWSEASESMRGTPFNFHFWRYTVPSGTSSTGWEPYGGRWSWTGADAPGTPIFPIDIMAVLVFFILAELGQRFNQVVLMIARDLAGASTDLSRMQGSISEFFTSQTRGGGGRGGGFFGPGGGRRGMRGGLRDGGGPVAGAQGAGPATQEIERGGVSTSVADARDRAFPRGGDRDTFA